MLWQGKDTLGDLESHLDRILVDPGQPSIRKQITDLRFAALEGSFGERPCSAALGMMEKHRDVFAGKMLAVVTGDEFDRARMFDRVVKTLSVNIIVFSDLDPACLWLGVDRKLVDGEFRALRAGPVCKGG